MTIPPNLARPENKPFLNRIKKELLFDQRTATDPSLQWIIDANLAHAVLDNNPAFDLTLFPSSNWIEGTPEQPTNYSIQLDQRDFNQLYYTDEEKPEWYDEQKTNGYLIYYGVNHANLGMFTVDSSKIDSNGFSSVQRNNSYVVSTTAHGIVAQKKNTYKWLFVNDMPLTNGPDKLRWYSIGDVVLYDHYIVFQHLLGTTHYSQFFLIDLETGVCARLKETGINFKLEADRLLINVDDSDMNSENSEEYWQTAITLDLQTLIQQFSTLSIRD